MIIGVLLVTGLACAWYSIASWEKELNILKSLLMTVTGYLFSHIILSGLLFWVDQYSVKRTLLACVIVWGILCGITIGKHKRPKLIWKIRDYLIPIIVTIIALPFVWQTFGFYGFGQDEGVYQTQAICFMNGMTERQLDFEEYYHMGTDSDRQAFADAVSENNLVGFYYCYSDTGEYYITQSESQAISERSGVFHGIPTFSALMALWGSLFGVEHMMGINTLIFICSIFMLYEICSRFQLKALGKTGTLMVYAFSPLVIWVSKSALTEIGITLIWMSFLYFLLGDTKREIILSAICITVYAFFHVSVYVFMPLYVVLYIGLYLQSKDNTYVKAMILAVLGYVTGYWMQQTVASEYTNGNYKKLYHWFVNADNAPYIIMGVCLGTVLLGVLLLKQKPDRKRKLHRKTVTIGFRTVIGISLVAWLYQVVTSGLQFHQFANVTLLSFVIVAGILVPVIVYCSAILFTGRWTENRQYSILLGLFVYCILIFSAFFKLNTDFYYYFARYQAAYIPVIAVMGGIILQRHKAWKGILTIVLGTLLMLPYNKCLMLQKDDTRVEWRNLVSIAEQIQAEDNLILDKELFPYYYFPLKAMTGARIYPVLDDFEGETEQLYQGDNQVYYLTVHYGERAETSYTLSVELTNTISEDQNVRFEDYQNPLHNQYLQLPTAFEQRTQIIQLFQYNHK